MDKKDCHRTQYMHRA